MTDTNQASEDELTKIIDEVYLFGMNGGLGYEKFDNELSPNDAKAAINALIRNEKLKLLAEVRERVVEQAKPDKRKATSWQQGIEVSAYEDAVRVYEYKMDEQLTKLEAEL